MANEKNLTPFKKGQSGNPRGRPKKLDIKGQVQALLEQETEITYQGKKMKCSHLQAIFLKQIEKAEKKQDTRAAQFVMDYAFGKPTAVQDSEEALTSLKIEFIDGK